MEDVFSVFNLRILTIIKPGTKRRTNNPQPCPIIEIHGK
jgi:hypothetical protein